MTPFKKSRLTDGPKPAMTGDSGLTLSTMRSMTGQSRISAAAAPTPQARVRRGVFAWVVSSLLVAPLVSAAGSAEPLPVDAAFALTASFVNQSVAIRFDVQPGHYLYSDRFEVKQDGATSVELQRMLRAGGTPKQDPNFGLVKVYTTAVNVQLKPKKASQRDAPSPKSQTELEVTFQGCSEVAGVCYPPARRIISLTSGATDVKPQDAAAPNLKLLFKKQVSQ